VKTSGTAATRNVRAARAGRQPPAEVFATERVDRLCRDREGGEFRMEVEVRLCPLRRASRTAERQFVATRNTEVF